MLRDNPDKLASVSGVGFLDDLIHVSCIAITKMDEETKFALYMHQPELTTHFVELLDCQMLQQRLDVLDLIGETTNINEAICSQTAQRPGFLRSL